MTTHDHHAADGHTFGQHMQIDPLHFHDAVLVIPLRQSSTARPASSAPC
jgi:hypothetical protein